MLKGVCPEVFAINIMSINLLFQQSILDNLIPIMKIQKHRNILKLRIEGIEMFLFVPFLGLEPDLFLYIS